VEYVTLNPPVPATPATTPTVASAAELARQWFADGLRPGLPTWVSIETAAIDSLMLRKAKCPGCGKRGLQYNAWGDRSRYRVLASCSCGCAEEF
jgi:hypothetical protein